jgi:ABC-2 type transport system permease protein
MLRAVARKEFIHLRRDARMATFVVGAPALFLILFGYALRLSVEDLAIAVWDRDRSLFSLEVKDRLVLEAGFRLIEATSEADITRRLRSGEARLGLVIPPDFARRLTDNEQTRFSLFVDGTMPVLAQAALYGAQVIAGDETAQALVFADPERALPPVRARPVAIDEVVLFNPDLRDAYFFLPGIIGVVIMQVTLILASVGLVREKEQQTIEPLLATPISPLALVAGKLVPYALIAGVDFVIVLALGHVIFDLPVHGSPAAIGLLALLYIAALLTLGSFLATFSETQPQAIFLAVFVLLPSILLSGFVFPLEAMPGWLRPVAWFLPMTYYVDGIRALLLKDAALRAVLADFAVLAAFALFFGALSLARFRKRLA